MLHATLASYSTTRLVSSIVANVLGIFASIHIIPNLADSSTTTRTLAPHLLNFNHVVSHNMTNQHCNIHPKRKWTKVLLLECVFVRCSSIKKGLRSINYHAIDRASPNTSPNSRPSEQAKPAYRNWYWLSAYDFIQHPQERTHQRWSQSIRW